MLEVDDSGRKRQEYGLIQAIKKAVMMNENNPISISTGKSQLNNIYNAKTYGFRQATGYEPYTDVQLTYNQSKQYNLSLKGDDAPSLAGGGLTGLRKIAPNLIATFYKQAFDQLIDAGYKEGDNVPDIFARIPNQYREKIIVGNAEMGGPIDYMYKGPMAVHYTYDRDRNLLKFNGTILTAKEFAKTTDLYFRLRKRSKDQTFDLKEEKEGLPAIFGRSNMSRGYGGRLMTTDRVPASGFVIRL